MLRKLIVGGLIGRYANYLNEQEQKIFDIFNYHLEVPITKRKEEKDDKKTTNKSKSI